jgi:type VI secretion system secreted protein VgrG
MPRPTQATRHIAIDTPLGEDVLLLRSFSGHEEISRLFELDLDLLSEDYEINFDDIIGQNVTIRMELPDGGTRFWNGYINRFVQGVSTSPQFARYRATMVPWLWFLTRTSDCRIFQEKPVPDIIKQIFKDLGFSDIEDRLSGGYRTWNYCVQYRETDFNFVSRLMEHEGIYYYFLHEQGKCTIVLCDSLSKHDPYGDYDEIDFTPDTKSSALQERISEWTVEKRIRSGKFAHIDYNFEKPSTSLMSDEEDKKPHIRGEYEIFDYPGEYSEKEDGDRYAKVRMEELAQSHEVCSGRSESRGICSGYVFTLAKHTRRDQNREYLVVSTDYQAAAEDYETSGGLDEMCACSFTAIPSSIQFRPERTSPKPIIQGTQTAVVTGPSGEEIYTDEHGRVKIQFHWDREGKYDENSSCWIRVSQIHAGKSFGGIDIPRIGEEVVVGFMEGDPDRPIITGRVYNAELMPPFGLPGKKVVSGMKSNSTPGGGGYNEITLDDTKGKEGLTIHAQYDMNTTVEHDQTITIKSGNRTLGVNTGTNTETIKGNASLTIQAGSRTVSVTGGNYSATASDAIVLHGKGKGVGITGNGKGVSVMGTPDVFVEGKSNVTLKSPVIDIGDKEINIGGTKVVISVGGNSITLDPAGVTIKGALVKIN